MGFILILLFVVLIIAILGLVVFLIFNSLGFFVGAPYATTPAEIVNKLFKLVEVGKDDLVYDLGSGDGRVLIAAVRQGARAVGWEINLPLYLYSIRRVKRTKFSQRIKIHFGNFWTKKLSAATVIFAFLLPQYMKRLEQKLNQEVAPGTKVVTYLARLSNRLPIKTTDDGLTIYQF